MPHCWYNHGTCALSDAYKDPNTLSNFCEAKSDFAACLRFGEPFHARDRLIRVSVLLRQALLDHFGIEKTVLYGYDWGGGVGFEFALQVYPAAT